jgi:hypothetical protein
MRTVMIVLLDPTGDAMLGLIEVLVLVELDAHALSTQGIKYCFPSLATLPK